MKSKLLWALLLFIAGSIPVLTSLAVYWYNEAPPVSYSRREILTPSVPPGGPLMVKISAELTKDCVATSHRTIVDAAGVETDYAPVTRPAVTDFVVTIQVPLGATPGPAKYRSIVEWNCNPVQAWYPRTIYLPELPFTVEPAPQQEQIPQQQGVFEKPPLIQLPVH
jgi:hypothetical protein